MPRLRSQQFFLKRDIRRNVLSKFVEICIETPCWCHLHGHQHGYRKSTKTCHWVLLQKRKFISRGTQKRMNFSDIKIPRNKLLFSTNMTALLVVTQKLRNSSAVYHKTKIPFGAKICMDITFQLLLYIMKVKSQEDYLFCSLNFSDVMSKHPIQFCQS